LLSSPPVKLCFRREIFKGTYQSRWFLYYKLNFERWIYTFPTFSSNTLVLNVPYTHSCLKGVRKAAEICLQCGVCCAVPEYGCPAQYDAQFDPKNTYVYDCLGHQQPSTNPNIWQCVSCHKCEEMCPYEVSPVTFMEAMKVWALEEGHAPDSIIGEIEQIVNTGYAFPLTANTERQRQQLGLEPIKANENLKAIAKGTGLLELLGRHKK